MIIKVRLIPGAQRNEVISRIGSVLRVKITHKKVDDDPANAIMKAFLADFFNVSEESIILVKGAKGKEKTVRYWANIHGKYAYNEESRVLR